MLLESIDPMQDQYLWPDWKHSALLTIDVQRDFAEPGAAAEIPGTRDIIGNIAKLLGAFRKKGLPVFHVIRLYLADGSNVDICRRSRIEAGARIADPGSQGSQLVGDLLPDPNIILDHDNLLKGKLQQIGDLEWIIYKPRFGAFYNTILHEKLQELGVNTLVFSGCNFPNCPRTTMYQASERDYRIVMARDAVSALYDKGIQEVIGIGINVMKSNSILDHINEGIL